MLRPRRRKPVPHHRRANHIRHQLVLVPIPRKQHRARTAAPIRFFHRNHLRMRQIDLVLQNSRRPQNAQQIDAIRIAQPDQNLRRSLRREARRAGQFPLLPLPVGKDLHLRADRRLVVRIAAQVEPHKVILVRAHIAQQHRRRILLRHNQVRRAIAIHIRRNQSARRLQRHAVQPQRVAHILKAPIAAVAKHPHPRPGARLHNRRQVNPSIVVDIDRASRPIRASHPAAAAPRAQTAAPHSAAPPRCATASVPARPHASPQYPSSRLCCSQARQCPPSAGKSSRLSIQTGCCGYFPSRGFT